MPEELIYRPVPEYTRDEIKAAILRDDIELLISIAFAVGYHSQDWKYAQDLCIQLSDHPHKTVRGNALLGLSYVALFRHKLDKRLVKPILLRGLRDTEEEVRERAQDAIFEINRAMKWSIGKYERKEKIEGINQDEEVPITKRRL